MLSAVDPVDGEIDEKQRHCEFDHAREALQAVNRAREGWRGEVPDKSADQPRAGAVDGEGKGKGQNIPFQVQPTIDWPGWPKPLADVEYQDQREKRGDLVVVRTQCHGPIR